MRTAEAIPADACPRAQGVPMLGIGTWQNDDHDTCVESVRTALDMGYRHVDTAEAYGNEAAVGEAIAAANIDRDAITVATKVWASNLAPEDVRTAAESSRDRLGIDVIDILYVHWPSMSYDPAATLDAFSDLRDDGLIRNVGVSNFETEQLRTAVDRCEAPILMNQVELHPLLPQPELVDTCQDLDIGVVAYSPLARGAALEHPAIRDVADRHDATPAQICLAWLRERGCVAIPKATGRDHIAENWQSLEVSLDSEDMDRIADIEDRQRAVDPDFAPWQ